MTTTITPKHKVLYLYVWIVMMPTAQSNSMFFSPVFGQLCLVGFFVSSTELEKLRHTSYQDLAINLVFKCDECSYMAISRTILKPRTTMTHPNKDEPRPRGSSCWFLLFTDRAEKVKTHLSSGPCNKSYI